MRDITRRKQAEEVARLFAQSKELDRLKTEFFANISHELRTPLTLILGPVRKRLAAAGIGEEEKRDLELVERNASLLLRHVNDLLDLGKIDAGRMTAEYAEIDLARMVRLAASNFESLLRDRGIAFALAAPDSLVAQVDPPKIERVLLNLLSNACKFTPAGGSVRISAQRVNGRAIIEIEDSGPGIPVALRELIFERFRQLDTGTDRRFGGTGLGLSIVKQFVTLHRGTIAVEDPPGGAGALFRVDLPLSAPAGADVRHASQERDGEIARQAIEELRMPEPARHLPAPPKNFEAPVVLLVEDNLEMNAFIAETLSATCQVQCAFDGQDGLVMALSLHPDLILCDIMMPRMSGDQLVREIRRHDELEDVPIVLLTAKADRELQVRLLREGAQDYLHKPFDAGALLAKVARLIGDRRRRKETEEALHWLSGGLLQVHDQERKEIAYQLHENIVQCLAALEINLSLVHRGASLSPEAQQVLDEGHALVEQCAAELRTMSYGLHPPLLDHFGLRAAMEAHIRGFVQHSGIEVTAQIPHDLGRLPAEFELALFRIMQETLMNLRCHAGSKKAAVRAFRDAFEVGLEVTAEGEASLSPAEPAADIAIAAMRERVRRLGGRLELVPGKGEAILRAFLPLQTEVL